MICGAGFQPAWLAQKPAGSQLHSFRIKGLVFIQLLTVILTPYRLNGHIQELLEEKLTIPSATLVIEYIDTTVA
jgi:hypothetical protein